MHMTYLSGLRNTHTHRDTNRGAHTKIHSHRARQRQRQHIRFALIKNEHKKLPRKSPVNATYAYAYITHAHTGIHTCICISRGLIYMFIYIFGHYCSAYFKRLNFGQYIAQPLKRNCGSMNYSIKIAYFP